MPVRPLALGRRMVDSTSSHSDLAALVLQRATRTGHTHTARTTNHKSKPGPLSANQSCREAPPSGEGVLLAGGSACVGLTGQRQAPPGAELPLEDEHPEPTCESNLVPSLDPTCEGEPPRDADSASQPVSTNQDPRTHNSRLMLPTELSV